MGGVATDRSARLDASAVIRFLVYLLLGLLGVNSYADSVPATWNWYVAPSEFSPGGHYTSAAAACADYAKNYGVGTFDPNNSLVGSSGSLPGSATCNLSQPYNGWAFTIPSSQYCPQGTLVNVGGVMSCNLPDCPPGQTRQSDGSCAVPCPAAGSSAMVGGAAAWKISGGSSACVAGFTYSGCAVKCTSGVSSGGSAACTGCSFTGAPGDASNPNGTPVPAEQKTNPTTPEGCLASGKGYITGSTGITTCISGTEAPASQPVQTTEKTKTTTTNEQGQSTTTEGTKTTECSGGNCTETTSSTGPNGTSTVAEEKPASNFCSENPTSPMCKEAKDPCEDHPERVGCLDKGEPEDGDALSTENRGVTSVTPRSFSSSASCPADVNLPKGAKLSYSYPCQLATSLRPIILAIAWLIAGFIVMGAFRDG